MIAAAAQIPAYNGTLTVTKFVALILLLLMLLAAGHGKGLKQVWAEGLAPFVLVILIGVLVWYA